MVISSQILSAVAHNRETKPPTYKLTDKVAKDFSPSIEQSGCKIYGGTGRDKREVRSRAILNSRITGTLLRPDRKA